MTGINFTQRARNVIAISAEEARRFNHQYVGTEHILLGLTKENDGPAIAVLRKVGVDVSRLREDTEKLLPIGPDSAAQSMELPFTSRAKQALDFAASEAREMGHAHIGTEHLLLGLLREKGGFGSQVLIHSGADLDTARAATLYLLGP